MPQVASDPKIYAPNHSLPRMGRPAQQSDHAPSPFESLLDDSAQSADQPTSPSPENKAGLADSSQAPARNNECKPPAINDDAPAPKSDQADDVSLKLGGDGKVVCEGKSDVNAKVSTAAGETIKTDENGEKPTGGPKADNPAIVTPPTDNIQTISAAAVVGLVPALAPVADQTPKPDPTGAKQPDQMAKLVAAVGNDASTLKGLDPVDSKAGTGKQTAAEKKTDVETQVDTDVSTPETMADSQPAAITPQSHVAKPHFAPSDSDKEHITQARGEGVSDSIATWMHHRRFPAVPLARLQASRPMLRRLRPWSLSPRAQALPRRRPRRPLHNLEHCRRESRLEDSRSKSPAEQLPAKTALKSALIRQSSAASRSGSTSTAMAT